MMEFLVTDKINTPIADKTRRAALKSTVQVAIAAPAVALLLDAQTKANAAANISVSAATTNHTLDDFTFGNNNDDFVGTIDDGVST
jgi:hypothetical protein